MMIAAHDLEVVVDEADPAERRGGHHGNPDVDIRQVRPQQRGDERGGQDQQPAHRRRSGLRAMTGRSLLTNHLTDLKLAQPPHHPRSEQQADGERRQARRGGPERDVTGHVQHRHLRVERVEKVIEHRCYTTPELLRRRPSASRATATSSNGSTCAPITWYFSCPLPAISTTSPGRAMSIALAIAS